MVDAIERVLENAVAGELTIGEVLVRRGDANCFILTHRADARRSDLQTLGSAEDAIAIAKQDDCGSYRPLKTAPNLRRGWRLELPSLREVRRTLDYFYPGRLALFLAWKADRLSTTPIRQTLARQSGMYRVAATISDDALNDVIAGFCQSDTGCLRTILWKRDEQGTVASTKLPSEKFDPEKDQSNKTKPAGASLIPLLCQEGCNLLVNQCRKAVKLEGVAPSTA